MRRDDGARHGAETVAEEGPRAQHPPAEAPPSGFDRPTLVALAGLSVGVLLAHVPGRHGTAWHWFHDAARLLVGDPAVEGAGGLSLYVDRADFQFGPVAVVAAVPFTVFGRTGGQWLAAVAASALGVLAAYALAAAARRVRPDALAADRPGALLVGAALLIVTWGSVAVLTTHLDDAIALCATALAVWALTERRPGAATLLLALAAAVKPWAVVFVPLLLVVDDRRRFVRPAVAAGLAVATWVPFVLAAPETLDVRSHDIFNQTTSALRAIGVTAETTPGWVRPVQLLGGMAVVGLLVLVGRWPAALMTGVALRLLLDPGANRYYTVGLVLAVLVFEWVDHPRRLPWLALGTAALLEASQIWALPDALGGWLRLTAVAAVVAAAARSLAQPAWPPPGPAGGTAGWTAPASSGPTRWRRRAGRPTR